MVLSDPEHRLAQVLDVVVGVLNGLVLVLLVVLLLLVQDLHSVLGRQLSVRYVPENHHVQTDKRTLDRTRVQVKSRVVLHRRRHLTSVTPQVVQSNLGVNYCSRYLGVGLIIAVDIWGGVNYCSRYLGWGELLQ